jgi:hypothetical protein
MAAGNPASPNPLKKGYTATTGGKVITGARAIVSVNGNIVGIFESCTVANSLGTEPIFILGRHSPDEIAITSSEAVNVTCSGFRVLGAGVHTLPAVPLVQDLLLFDPFTITVVDRSTQEVLETILGCVPSSNNTNYNAKATSKVNITYIGIISYNEDANDNDPGNSLP